MPVTIDPIGPERLAEYASVPMVLEVCSTLVLDGIDPGSGGLRGLSLRERPVQAPYRKDYDAYEDGGPLRWPERFDLSHWGLWVARDRGEAVGAAAVAWRTSGLDMLKGRDDIAVLWDIRVHPASQRQGIGSALFREAARWAKSKGCKLLKIETQDVKVPACRFYTNMGCRLAQIERDAYRRHSALTSEVMLIWEMDLPPA